LSYISIRPPTFAGASHPWKQMFSPEKHQREGGGDDPPIADQEIS